MTLNLLEREKVYNVSGGKTPSRNEHGIFSRLSKGYLSSRLRTPKFQRTPKNTERFVISSPKDFNHVTHVDPRDVKGNFGNNKSIYEQRLPRAERPGSFYINIPPVSKELAEEFENSEFHPGPFARSPSINFLDQPVPVRQNLLDKFSESKKYSQSMDDLSFWSSPRRGSRGLESPLVKSTNSGIERNNEETASHVRKVPKEEASPNDQREENRLSLPEERVASPASSYRSSLSSRSPTRTTPEKLTSSDRATKAPSIEDLLAKFKTKPVRQPHRSAAASSAFSASASSRGSCDSLNESLRSYPVSSRISENTPLSRSSVGDSGSSSFISPTSCFIPQAPARRTVLSEGPNQSSRLNNSAYQIDGNHNLPNRLSAPVPKPRSKPAPPPMLSMSLNHLDDDIEPDVVCNL
ncbi:Oidioi.mRNA.OKI2018_I69.chr1.g3790.t1.cds [Oikopleura dioica]|uniref:Oidioi.mRNA.OKI2018_I69.chr1.g3790.t1.cds n=1 Tax=Oikopleura dioica TaxID=34765 RepID=A0ABN7SV51_OIKDI|nr:Oidioi.mRNA.OKI2018_I69.chr1.g3790.t1.cds [Oikopleura dioica]